MSPDDGRTRDRHDFLFCSTIARSRSSLSLSSGVNSSPKSSISNTWRISISESLIIGFGHRLTHSIASSSDLTCHTQKPAISSFDSANGPSTTVRLSPENRTRTPFELGCSPSDDDARGFAQAIGDWPAFHDTAPALRRLHERFRLGVITNCDRDLFALSNRRLGVTFDWIVTAEDARAYKPNQAPFQLAFETIDTPRERILHAAQSLFHDHVPGQELGLTTVDARAYGSTTIRVHEGKR